MIAQFALRLLCGISSMWAVMPRKQVTSGFFRIQMLVALGLSVLAALTSNTPPIAEETVTSSNSISSTALTCAFMGVLAFVGSVVWTIDARKPGNIIVLLITAVSTVTLLRYSWPTSDTSQDWQLLLYACSELSSAWLIGAATTSMLLGHWYLTAPTMSLAPLTRLTHLFGVTSVLRLLVSAVALIVTWDSLGSGTHTSWLILRWLAGIAGPLAAYVMTVRILRYKNTQAATGVLFVGVILTFIGETTASLLFLDLGQPL